MAVDPPDSTSSSSLHHKTDTTPAERAVATSAETSMDEKDREKQGDAVDAGAAAAADGADKDDVREITGIRWILICLALYISALMYGLDTTIAADVQGAVIGTFDDVRQLAWIGAGFPLGSVAVILPYGFLFTAFNMKWLYIAGIILFQAGSALCGAAPNMNALIVGRVIAGAGGTGIYLGGLNHFSAMTTRRERSLYLTGTGFVWGLGAILGPVVGGGFSVSSATWRWGFYINLVIGAVTAPIYLFCLPSIDPAPGKSFRERASSLDYLGFVLSAGTWTFFTMGFIFAGGEWAWNDGRSITFVVLFGVLLLGYALQQYFCLFTTPDTRCFPGHLLLSRTQVLMYITTSCANAAMFFTTFYIPIYFQFTQNDDSLMAAVRLLPFLLVLISVNLATGWVLPKINYYMPVCLVSGILITLASALFFAYLSPSTPTGHIYGFSILMGVGAGITMQLGYAVASLKVPRPQDIFGAINMQNVAQIGATVICLVIAGQVFQSTAVRNLSDVLRGHNYTPEQIHNMVAGAQSDLVASLSGELRARVIKAIISAMRLSFVIPLVAGIVSIVSAALMRVERMLG
ncbi:major facilitator superfamily domain-containing protein [Achaetomium macrosporum]|uniref:Major facilitator superfamily domain-containing protein n=1 Tax=Achaetomium macrosporum TaxID=79813 RepID=A0AAN7C6P6_9PEZI|nr:major facilitator superfamily domain-containing protein [Achaetomium macrosporum]